MTSIEQLQDKHYSEMGNGNNPTYEDLAKSHSNISIQFAIECLEGLNNKFNKEVMKNQDSVYLSGMKTLLITNKINELKKQIQ